MYKEQVKRQMAELDPIKRMEVDPNYTNAVTFHRTKTNYSLISQVAAAGDDELAKAKLKHEYILYYKQEYDYYISYYEAEVISRIQESKYTVCSVSV